MAEIGRRRQVREALDTLAQTTHRFPFVGVESRLMTMTKFMLVLILLASAAALAGCNTIAGAGQDTQAAGKAVTNAADKVKQGL